MGFAMNSLARHIATLVLACVALAGPTPSHASEADVRRVWQLLDYLAVDYGGAVKNGAVLSQSEYSEMREFARSGRDKLAALEARPEQAALVKEADELSAAIETKTDPETVATLAKALGNHLLAVYPVPAVPAAIPDVKLGATVFQAQCATRLRSSGARRSVVTLDSLTPLRALSWATALNNVKGEWHEH